MKTADGLAWTVVAATLACGAGFRAGAAGFTLPIALDHNRILVDVQFEKKDGSFRKARAWVDSGGPSLILGGPLAKELGIEWEAPADAGREAKVDTALPRGMRFGDLPLPLDGVACTVCPHLAQPFAGVPAEARLPSAVMSRFDVLFDYPGRRMTLAPRGTLRHRGVRVPCLVEAKTGIVQFDVRMAGETVSFALDNGATCTLVREDLAVQAGQRNPAWATRRGLLGCANMWGMEQETEWAMIRLGEILVGGVAVSDAGAACLPKGLFEWYSKKTASPVAGLLGPNVLKAFRVGIDFAGGAVYLELVLRDDPHDMDLVGLTLRPNRDGTFDVIAAAESTGAMPGDRLLKVGGLDAAGQTMGQVVDALRGKPGSKRRLVLERRGETRTVEATVIRYL